MDRVEWEWTGWNRNGQGGMGMRKGGMGMRKGGMGMRKEMGGENDKMGKKTGGAKKERGWNGHGEQKNEEKRSGRERERGIEWGKREG